MIRALWIVFMALLFGLTGCSEAAIETAQKKPEEIPAGANVVTVVGAIHGQHKSSNSYSLKRLEQAIRQFEPTIVMVELPPENFIVAAKNFRETGKVNESRADDFPELTEVIFPLSKEQGFTMIPVAAWSQDIAADRRAKLAAIENDPARADDWQQYQSAAADFRSTVRGRSDDPMFIHSLDYDAAVKTRQGVYERLFGKDLDAGGWAAINEAHYARIADALDRVSGHEQRVLILFGAWHKYWFLERLETRSDVAVIEAASLFAE